MLNLIAFFTFFNHLFVINIPIKSSCDQKWPAGKHNIIQTDIVIFKAGLTRISCDECKKELGNGK